MTDREYGYSLNLMDMNSSDFWVRAGVDIRCKNRIKMVVPFRALKGTTAGFTVPGSTFQFQLCTTLPANCKLSDEREKKG